jgi:hypothetical protein
MSTMDNERLHGRIAYGIEGITEEDMTDHVRDRYTGLG